MASVDLDFDSVRDHWLAAGGKDTGGIIHWFAPVVVRWTQTEIRVGDVADLYFIGAEGGGRWVDVTGGSNRVRDLDQDTGAGLWIAD